MNCPSCATTLQMTERQGIEIDYCPSCRGVWLDRGELDKIVECAAGPPGAEVRGPAELGRAPARRDWDDYARRDERRRYDRDDRDYGERYYDDDDDYRRGRRRSFLRNLFDFD